MKDIAIAVLIIAALTVVACGSQAAPTVDMANPASKYCVDQGYELEIRTAADGSQQGFCIFADGTECDEWAYYRGECGPGQATGSSQLANPASVFCEDQGGTVEIRTAADGSQQGFCLFADGTECDEWAFFRGECAPGTPQP
jgi:hypothetical protein